jgi:hypothetical protein
MNGVNEKILFTIFFAAHDQGRANIAVEWETLLACVVPNAISLFEAASY